MTTTKKHSDVASASGSSLLDCFVRIQLLYDPSFKRVQVSDIDVIPQTPKITAKKVHLRLGSRSDVLKKELVKTVTHLSQFQGFELDPGFKQSVVAFYKANESKIMSMDTKTILDGYASFVSASFSDRTKQYYVQQVQLIDMLLLCKKITQHQKELLLSRRQNLLAVSYTQIPNISDQSLRKAICTEFCITDHQLQKSIVRVRQQVSARDIASTLSICHGRMQTYTKEDFSTLQKYETWQDMCAEMYKKVAIHFSLPSKPQSNGQTNGKSTLIPSDFDSSVLELTSMVLHGNTAFFQAALLCLQAWQLLPYQVFGYFMNSATRNYTSAVPGSLVQASSLSYLSSPMQITWYGWPISEQKNTLDIGIKIFRLCKDKMADFFGEFFANRDNFTTALTVLQQLHLTANQFEAKKLYHDALTKSFTDRLVNRLQLLKKDSGLDYKSMNAFLSKVVSDFDLLHNWKIKNKDLNRTFGVQNSAEKIMGEPVLNYVKLFIESLRSTTMNPENRENMSSFLGLVGRLKRSTNLKFDFEKDLFVSFSQIVDSWAKELLEKVKVVVSSDSELERLEGCSYSNSVPNVMGICNAYLKLLDSFQWSNKTELAVLYTRLYKGISESLIYYTNLMLSRFSSGLGKSLNFQGESCTCLNNVSKIVEYFREFDTKELHEYGKTMADSAKLRHPRKFVSLIIKDAENVENSKGEPVSLSVRISGLLNCSTRRIWKDYNPSWDEEFESFIGEDVKDGMFHIELNDEGGVYKSLNYYFNLTDRMPLEEKISLEPKSGALNISVNVECEQQNAEFYLSRAESEITKGRDRAVKIMVDMITSEVREIFSREHLKESLKLSPIKRVSNYKDLKDEKVDSYVSEMQLHTIDELYDNLETELFDAVMLQVWLKILQASENLVLPRISLIFHRIVARLNKRSSIANVSVLGRYQKTSKHEMERVVEWCWKLRQMMNMPEKVLQEPLEAPFKEFCRIPQLYGLKETQLEDSYYQSWSYISRELPKKYVRADYSRESLTKASGDKVLLLRVLLSKGRTKFVKGMMEKEERYERALQTEIEIENGA